MKFTKRSQRVPFLMFRYGNQHELKQFFSREKDPTSGLHGHSEQFWTPSPLRGIQSPLH